MKFIKYIFLLVSINLYSTNYYVDNTGVGDTLTALSQVNALSLNYGDTVFFKSGCTWNSGYIEVKSGVVYTSYGDGNLPLFTAYESLNMDGSWSDLGGNIWQYTGITSEVGNIVLNNNSAAIRAYLEGNVNEQGDYWYDGVNDLVKLYSIKNPASFYSDIKACLDVRIFYAYNDSDFVIENFAIKYTGRYATWATRAVRARYENLYIDWVGGRYYNNNYREGNGIAFWISAKNVIVENCIVRNCFDAGISPQYTTNLGVFDSIYIRNNFIENCEYGIEYFNEVQDANSQDLFFNNNVIVNSGYGWGHNQRPDQGHGNAIMIGTSGRDYSYISLSDNVFYNSRECHIFSASTPQISSDNNVFLSNKISTLTGTDYIYLSDHQAQGLDLASDSVYTTPTLYYNATTENDTILTGYSGTTATGTFANGIVLEPFTSAVVLDSTALPTKQIYPFAIPNESGTKIFMITF